MNRIFRKSPFGGFAQGSGGGFVPGQVIPELEVTELWSPTFHAGSRQRVYGRKVLTEPLTLYVATDGSDDNDGLTPATAMRSFTNSRKRLEQDYNFNRQKVTISIASGTWQNEVLEILRGTLMNAGAIEVAGAGVGSTIFDVGADGAERVGMLIRDHGATGATTYVKDITLRNATNYTAQIECGAYVVLGNMEFGPHLFRISDDKDIYVAFESRVGHWGGSAANKVEWLFSAGDSADFVIAAMNRSIVHLQYVKAIFTPARSAKAFLQAYNFGFVRNLGATDFVFEGSFTGSKGILSCGSQILMANADAANIPGTTPLTQDGSCVGIGNRFTLSTTDLIAGTSQLENGNLYLVYE